MWIPLEGSFIWKAIDERPMRGLGQLRCTVVLNLLNSNKSIDAV